MTISLIPGCLFYMDQTITGNPFCAWPCLESWSNTSTPLLILAYHVPGYSPRILKANTDIRRG